MPRVAILFDNFGPYHIARLRAASKVCDLLALEFGVSSAEYDWDQQMSEDFKRVAINMSGPSNELNTWDFRDLLSKELDRFQPEVVVIPGWSTRGAILALEWCIHHGVPSVVMSESTEWDASRSAAKEMLKGGIVGMFSSALVGGTSHRDYLIKLGMASDRISFGYDVVDNGFFAEKSEELGARSWELGDKKKPYFLASARFIEKKNLFRLLRAYARYRRDAARLVEGRSNGCVATAGPATTSVEGQTQQPSIVNEQPAPWDLILLGDGELRPDLEDLRAELGLEDCIQMPGFKQYEELPSYYAHAGAFIHASMTEQWGLVVNEAMASGLPVLVSNRCGCAADLVREGENGWTFDPTHEEQMASQMLKISCDEAIRVKMSARSREIIAGNGASAFGIGVLSAVRSAVQAPRINPNAIRRVLLKGILYNLRKEKKVHRPYYEAGYESLAIYHFFRRKVIAFPVSQGPLVLEALKCYNAHTIRRKIYKNIISLMIKCRAGGLISYKTSVSNSGVIGLDYLRWMKRFEDDLNIKELIGVVIWPSQASRRRVYIHLFDRDYQKVAFVKISFDRSEIVRLEKEIVALQEIEVTSDAKLLLMNKVISGHYLDGSYLGLSPLPANAHSPRWKRDKDVNSVLALYCGEKTRLNIQAVQKLSWWNDYLEKIPAGGEQFHHELLSLLDEGVDVCRVHGDLSVANLVIIGHKICIYDWESSHNQGPCLTDVMGYYLSFSVGKASRKNHLALFAEKFLCKEMVFRRVDVMMALAYRHAIGIPDAQIYIRHWQSL